jgi:hypothetical protein
MQIVKERKALAQMAVWCAGQYSNHKRGSKIMQSARESKRSVRQLSVDARGGLTRTTEFPTREEIVEALNEYNRKLDAEYRNERSRRQGELIRKVWGVVRDVLAVYGGLRIAARVHQLLGGL